MTWCISETSYKPNTLTKNQPGLLHSHAKSCGSGCVDINPSTAAGNYSCPNINFFVVRKATIVAKMSRRDKKKILLRSGGF